MGEEDHYLKEELYSLIREDPSVFEFLQEGALDGIWYWDLEKTEHEWMSPRFWTVLGYDPAERKHLASEWQDLIFPEDLEKALENFRLHCADPSHPYDQVVRYRHKDGSTIWVRCRGLAIRDKTGKPVRMLGAHNELTRQKRAEERLRNEERFLEAMFDAIQDGICVLDTELHVLRVNETMKRWYAGKHPLEGKKCYEVFRDRTEVCKPCPTMRAMASGKIEVSEIPHLREDGEKVAVEVFSYPMRDESGRLSGVVEYVRDITERKRAAREREKLIADLQTALSEVKTLRGFLPICASCKKIRDDQGYWTRIESYLQEHSEATLSHGLCPDCLKRYRAEMGLDD